MLALGARQLTCRGAKRLPMPIAYTCNVRTFAHTGDEKLLLPVTLVSLTCRHNLRGGHIATHQGGQWHHTRACSCPLAPPRPCPRVPFGYPVCLAVGMLFSRACMGCGAGSVGLGVLPDVQRTSLVLLLCGPGRGLLGAAWGLHFGGGPGLQVADFPVPNSGSKSGPVYFMCHRRLGRFLAPKVGPARRTFRAPGGLFFWVRAV